MNFVIFVSKHYVSLKGGKGTEFRLCTVAHFDGTGVTFYYRRVS